MFHWIGHIIKTVIITGVIGSVALFSSLLDAMIGLVGRCSDRLDAKLGKLAQASNARHRREGRRQVDPITLD